MRYPGAEKNKNADLSQKINEEDKRLAAEIQDGTLDFDEDEEMGEL